MENSYYQFNSPLLLKVHTFAFFGFRFRRRRRREDERRGRVGFFPIIANIGVVDRFNLKFARVGREGCQSWRRRRRRWLHR